MKVLVATSQMQGQRDNDFNWCDEGELVTFGGFECDGGEIDDNCGCRRSLSGTRSWRSTSTFNVAESELTYQEYIDHIVDTKAKQGWGGDYEMWAPQIDVMLAIAKQFPIGTVLERRGNEIQPRQKVVDFVQMQMVGV